MFNFKGPVTRVQLERFHAMAHFLGGCLDNITEFLKTLQTIFGTQMVLGSCLKQVKVAHRGVSQKLSDIRELELPMVLLNKYSEKLE